MANHFTKACFTFRCTEAELSLLREAFEASDDLYLYRIPPREPSAAFLAAFPPTERDLWSGFRATFADPRFPASGAHLITDQPDESGFCNARIAGLSNFQPDAVANLIQRCCIASLASHPIGFAWATLCDRARDGAFGGGWCLIHANMIEIETTDQLLDEALSCAA
ncbi:hypothetical protein KRZ98_16955 [Sphingobium sp. AS12]|uniref:hypothetical protein n=1 Tax=Sphingobium sp. AS12 TaxID=2849495 RepID=UPI001C31A029|nr:hypothetical protein [Sphingobium sp. AS12]MBV2149935.1 hypothetical protein [Sphingobium sp. AS12]